MHLSETARAYIERLIDAAVPEFDVAYGGCQTRQRFEAIGELVKLACAKAAEAARDYVTPDDIKQVAGFVIGRHISAGFIAQVLAKVPTD